MFVTGLLACSRGELEETEDKVEVIFPAIPYPTSQSTSQGKKKLSHLCGIITYSVKSMVILTIWLQWSLCINGSKLCLFIKLIRMEHAKKNKIYTKIVILKLVLFYLFFSVFFFHFFLFSNIRSIKQWYLSKTST